MPKEVKIVKLKPIEKAMVKLKPIEGALEKALDNLKCTCNRQRDGQYVGLVQTGEGWFKVIAYSIGDDEIGIELYHRLTSQINPDDFRKKLAAISEQEKFKEGGENWIRMRLTKDSHLMVAAKIKTTETPDLEFEVFSKLLDVFNLISFNWPL